jgi:thiosulfate/3-mercaptopyruvate sulfurtransferase
MIPSPLVSTEWLAVNLDRPELRIIDCSVIMKTTPDGGYGFVSGREEWAERHIPGAVFVDMLAEMSARDSTLPMMLPGPEELTTKVEALGIGDDTEVVLYDRSNHAWAARMWWMLRVYGFDAAAVLEGGWQKWSAEHRPTSDEVTSPRRGRFTPRFRPRLVATREQVLESIGKPEVAIVNALPPEHFRGTAPTDLPRAGRIAGSCNVYCQLLIDPETGAYWPAPKLRELFEEAGALGAERFITYCGAGIAASSDALALALLGVDNVAVYDGSLAEWAADPALPMEQG